MDTQLTYEVIGGSLGAIAVLIGLIGATRQQSKNKKKALSEQQTLTNKVASLSQENKNFVEALTLAKSAVNDFEVRLNQSTQNIKDKEKQRKKLEKAVDDFAV